MTKPEFQELHDSYADALQKYLAAANQLCTMLGDLAEYSPGIEQWGVIEAQWSLENHLFDQYHKMQNRLLEAAIFGYGSL